MGGQRSSSSAGAGIPLAVRSREDLLADLADEIYNDLPPELKIGAFRPQIEIVPDEEMGNSAAIVSRRDLRIGIRKSVAKDLEAYMSGARGDAAISAYAHLLHESIHLQSPALRSLQSTRHDAWFEEGFTEMMTRRVLTEKFPNNTVFGTYYREVAAVHSMSRSLGEETVMKIWQTPSSRERRLVMVPPIRSWLRGQILRAGGIEGEADVIVKNLPSPWRIFTQGKAHRINLATSVQEIRRALSELEVRPVGEM